MHEPLVSEVDAAPSETGGGGAASMMVEEDPPERLVDPTVSRAKFARELEAYRAQETEYRKRGWFLVRAEFPEVFVLMSSPVVRPSGIQYALLLDFTDYNLRAPSVRFVDPFTGRPLHVHEVTPILQKRPIPLERNEVKLRDVPGDIREMNGIPLPAAPPVVPAASAVPLQNLVQGHEQYPAFLCVPGTREYHAHPYHSNDPWFAYRGAGPGTLYYLLDIVWRHGILPMAGYEITIKPHLDLERVP